MMSPESEELSLRLVTCKKFKWLPGMAYWWNSDLDRVADAEPGSLRTDGTLLPAIHDPATLGCLLALVRDTWGLPHATPHWWAGSNIWSIDLSRNPNTLPTIFYGSCEAEALISALETSIYIDIK